jgi:hypothetical protein
MAETTGNTSETAAQLEAKVTDLTARLNAAAKRVEDSQEMITRQAAEKGDDSKKLRESAEAIAKLSSELVAAIAEAKALAKELTAAQAELAVLKAKGPTGQGGTTQPSVQEQINALTATLTEEDRKALDDQYTALPANVKSAMEHDAGEYLRFMQSYRKVRSADEAALPPWRKTPATNGSSGPANGGIDYEALFKQSRKRAVFQPPGNGSGGGVSRPLAMAGGNGRRPMPGVEGAEA